MSYNIEQHTYSSFIEYCFSGTGNIGKQEFSCEKEHADKSIYVKIQGDFDKLEDSCFADDRVCSVALVGGSYKHIGNNCFKSSNLNNVQLPEMLESIGSGNFSGAMRTITIPRLIKDFPVGNLIECNKLFAIYVAEENEHYQSIDGILYNKEVTKVVFCPNARTAPVILPKSVKDIGEYCFYNCKKLGKIIIPSSVETIDKSAFSDCEIEEIVIPSSVKTIGDSAFWSSKIGKLTIPDSVLSIGNYCFDLAKIAKLKLPSSLTTIQKETFRSLRSQHIQCSFNKVTNIDCYGLGFVESDFLLPSLSFDSLQRIGSSAFTYYRLSHALEFYSCLKSVGAYAFGDIRNNIHIRYFSMCPIELDTDALKRLPANATLVVPPGAKQIFERADQWSLFSKIIELPIDKDIIGGREEDVPQEVVIKRLKSILYSTCNYDSTYLKGIMTEVSQNFKSIQSDKEYEQACMLFRYNRMFTPAVIPGLDLSLVRNWPLKYQIRYVKESMASGVPVSQLFMLNQAVNVLSTDSDSLFLPMSVDDQVDDIVTSSVETLDSTEMQSDDMSESNGKKKMIPFLRRLFGFKRNV